MTATEFTMMYMVKLDLRKILKVMALTAHMVQKSENLEAEIER